MPNSLQVGEQGQARPDRRANAALPLRMHKEWWRQRCTSCHAAHAEKRSRRPSMSESRPGYGGCCRCSPRASTISCSVHEQPQERRAARRSPRDGVLNICSLLGLYACRHDRLLWTEICMVLAGQFCVACSCRTGTNQPGSGSSHQPVHPGQVHDVCLQVESEIKTRVQQPASD